MPVISIDLNQLSGVTPGVTNLKNAAVDFSPYRAYVTGDDEKVTRAIRKVKAPLGLAEPFLPPTPAGNAYEVQERGFRGARHGYVIVPDVAGPIQYTDLVWVDKDTLDPETPLSPAWLAALEALTEVVDNLPSLPIAQADVTGLPAVVEAVDTLTEDLPSKANAVDVIPAVTNVAPIGYGNSLMDERNGGVVPAIVTSASKMWVNRVATALGLPTPRNYGYGGTRSIETLFGLLSSSAAPGMVAPRVGSVWGGAIANAGAMVFLEDLGNDISHFLGSGSPVAISGAGGTRYLNAMQNIREAEYAVLSSQSVIQLQNGVTGVTFGGSGGWLDKNLDVAYVRGGKVAYTWFPGDYQDIVIPAAKIAQTGPLAGVVFAGLIQYDPATFANAAVTYAVDGVTQDTWTPPGWEVNGTANTSYGGIFINVPADGGDHTLRLTHAGANGELMTLNALFCASETPPDIFVKDGAGVKIGTYVPNVAARTIWNTNRDLVKPRAQAAVAKFPNVHWVPTNVPAGNLAADGIHPKDAGMERHYVDTLGVVRSVIESRQPVRVRLTA